MGDFHYGNEMIYIPLKQNRFMVSGEEANKFIDAWWKILLVGGAIAAVVGAFTKPETGILSGIVVIIAVFVYLIVAVK